MHKEFKDGKVVVLDSIATWMARKIAASFVLVKKTFTNRKWRGREGRRLVSRVKLPHSYPIAFTRSLLRQLPVNASCN